MKSVLNLAEYKEIRSRLENLSLDSEKQWGKMDVAQMLAHCNIPLEQATGKAPFKDESNFVSKTLIRWVVLNKIKKGDFGKNQPTVPSFVIVDEKDFNTEKQRLLNNIDDFYDKGNKGVLSRHPGFGAFTNEQWGSLVYVHLDHHLKQFSV
jgi:tetrahydromethanopterin S-methyltransferase subunit G